MYDVHITIPSDLVELSHAVGITSEEVDALRTAALLDAATTATAAATAANAVDRADGGQADHSNDERGPDVAAEPPAGVADHPADVPDVAVNAGSAPSSDLHSEEPLV